VIALLKVSKDESLNQPGGHISGRRYGYQKTQLSKIPEWIRARILGKGMKVIIPLRIWQEHWMMSQWAKGEYNTLMEVHEESEGVFRVTDWFMPDQDATGGGVRISRRGAIRMATDLLDRFEHMFGVFHIHPGGTVGSKHTPSMSGVDIEAMWTWVSNAGRGVFIVANASGMGSAVYVGKENDLLYQVPMTIEIDWHLDGDEQKDLRSLMSERINHTSYTIVHHMVPVKVAASSKTEDKDKHPTQLALPAPPKYGGADGGLLALGEALRQMEKEVADADKPIVSDEELAWMRKYLEEEDW